VLTLPLLAQVVAPAWTLGHLLVVLLVAAGVIAIAAIVFRQMGVTFPSWFVQILLIVALVVVGVVAIKFLLSL
jgi:hypothetical protein